MDFVQVGTGGVLVLNTALLLQSAFRAGQWSQRLLDLERRMGNLEVKMCPQTDCPLRGTAEDLRAER